MLVVVTGGTGYLGSHAIAALVGAGHRIRVLARSPERVPAALAPLGVGEVETVTGDVTDPVGVERALDEADAVLHAASGFRWIPQGGRDALRERPRDRSGAGHGARLGLDPIVYGSSELALLRPADGEALTPTRRSRAPWPDCRLKAEAELVARRYQEQGAPVVSVMPAALWDPHDPHFGEGVTRATNVLKKRYPMVMPGGMHIADVRDAAAALSAVMATGRGPRSYMVAGRYISMPDLIRALADLSGRRIRFATLPAWFLAAFGRAADVVQRRVKTRLPWDGEGIWVMNCAARCDDSQTRSELGLEPRPLPGTFADTVRWRWRSAGSPDPRRVASPRNATRVGAPRRLPARASAPPPRAALSLECAGEALAGARDQVSPRTRRRAPAAAASSPRCR